MSSVDPAAGLGGARRVVVYGVSGSGKSTVARAIGEASGLPWHPVDDLTWEPGWVEVPTEVQRDRVAAICAEDSWVLDAVYGKWSDIPFATVELVVGLDYPRWLSLTRLVRRTVVRLVRRTPVCNGNHETLRSVIAKDSIIGWHFRSFANKRRKVRAWEQDPAMPPVVRLTSARATREWLAAIRGISGRA